MVKATPHLQRCGNNLVRASKTNGGTREQTGLLICPSHRAGVATIPSSSLPVGSVRRLDSLSLWDLDQTIRRKELLYRGGDIERNPGPKTLTFFARAGCPGAGTCRPPLRNAMTCPFQNLKNSCESDTFMGSKNLSTAASINLVMPASSIFESALRQAALGRSSGYSGLMVVLIWRTTHSVFRTLWRAHRSWSLAIPAEFRTPVSHEIVLDVAASQASPNFHF